MNFAILAFSTLMTLASFVGLETMIASVDTRAEALRLEIATDDQMLGHGFALEQMSARTEDQLRECHLLDPASKQIVLAFADLEAIARNRQVQITTFRHLPFAGVQTQQHREPALRSDQFDVTLEGGYPSLLRALADLSRSKLIMHSSTATFERSGNRVRAALTLAVYRVEKSNIRNE